MGLSSLVQISSIGCACSACTRLLWVNDFSLDNIELATLVVHAQSAAMLPMVLVLLIASVKPEITRQVQGLNAHYLISALSLAYVSINSLQL
ncbi:hypothetical protein CGT94_17980 [Vibrio metoecus]|nr:hypothetical protein [Vibrio cholerae]PAR26362.1 hypothetical protein CGU00_19195 [Vibrio metoecus]EGQ9334158.1 hypothetical protein [Vibrio cholerae]EGQ9440874.1 hypothetical protein [Vibrio cholerae]EGQ9613139.1 hypothetical protein [Vibrio cholerae]